MKQSPSELRKISEGVFDQATLMTLYQLAKEKKLDELTGIVSTGKEANVYHGFLGEREIAVKVYCVEASNFRNMEHYIRGDNRFRKWKNRRQLVHMWARKEFKNFLRVYREVECPEPLAVEKNVLVMSFIGKDGVAAPRMKESPPENPEEFLERILEYMRRMYRKGFVHGDLSEYNILNNGEPVLIDFSQGILLDHPYAEELLRRDIRNMVDYFCKFEIEKNEEKVLEFVKGQE